MRLWTDSLAYCGPAIAPAGFWQSWNLDPVVIAGLVALAVVILIRPGLAGSRRTAGIVAIAVLAVAFVSPLCALTTSLFAARTVHHLLLICVVAPLLVWTMPRPNGRIGLGKVALATGLQAVVLWAWHVPSLYETALSSTPLYWLMQTTLMASAVLFWTAIRAASAPMAAFGLVLTMVQMGVLGALLVFGGSAVYAPHWLTTAAWGLSPLEDQQLAGLIMWAPAGGLYLAMAMIIVGRWLGADPRPRTAEA